MTPRFRQHKELVASVDIQVRADSHHNTLQFLERDQVRNFGQQSKRSKPGPDRFGPGAGLNYLKAKYFGRHTRNCTGDRSTCGDWLWHSSSYLAVTEWRNIESGRSRAIVPGTVTTIQSVVPCLPVHAIGAFPTIQDIVSVVTDQKVIPLITIYFVVTITTGQDVILRTAENAIVTILPVNAIGPLFTEQVVVPRTAPYIIRAGTAKDGV